MRDEPAKYVRRWLAAAGISVCLPLGRPAAAQDTGPVVINPQASLEGFTIEDLEAALEFEWRRNDDEIDGDPTNTRDVEDRYTETLELRADAFIGHPNFIDLDLFGRFSLRQRDFDTSGSGDDGRTTEELLTYNVSVNFFKERDTSFTLYSRRTQNDINRQFGGTLDNVFEENGGRIEFKGGAGPFSVEYFHRVQDQDDQTGNGDFHLSQDTLQLEGQVDRVSGQQLWWDFTYDDIDQSGEFRPTISFDRTEANLRHVMTFGEEERHRLRTTLRYYQETGDFDFRQFRASQRLRVQNTEHLATWYDLTYDDQRRGDVEQRRFDGSLSFRHELFESVISNGFAGYRRLDLPTDDFLSEQFLGEVNFDYTKKVPGGLFFGALRFGASHLDESDRGQPIQIVDETHTFDITGQFDIERRNIVLSSIVITDVSGIILYDEGIDYMLLGFFDRVEVRIIAGGDLSIGQTVLVDYELGPQPGGVTDTLAVGVEARYTIERGALRGVSIYSRLSWLDESRDFEVEDPRLESNDFTDIVYGIDYDIWKISLTAERQERDSDLSPFDQTRLEARYIDRIAPGSSIVLSAFYRDIDREEDDLRTKSTTLSARLNQRIDRNLRVSAEILWRDVDDSDGFDSEAFEQEIEMIWRYRQTRVFAEFRNSILNGSDEDRTFQTIRVGVRREF